MENTNNKGNNNNKLWSWTEKQHRKHHPFNWWVAKPPGCRHVWSKTQRAQNKRQLEKMMNGLRECSTVCNMEYFIISDVCFFDNHRHSGLWDLW